MAPRGSKYKYYVNDSVWCRVRRVLYIFIRIRLEFYNNFSHVSPVYWLANSAVCLGFRDFAGVDLLRFHLHARERERKRECEHAGMFNYYLFALTLFLCSRKWTELTDS